MTADQHEALSLGLRRILQLFAVFLAIHFLLPLIGGARSSLAVLSDGNVLLVLAGVVLQGASLAAYAQCARVLLPQPSRIGLLAVLRVQLAMLAITHLVPGGAAASAPVGYRLFRRSNVAPADAGFVLGLQGIGSAAVLNVLLWVTLAGSIPFRGFHPVDVVAVVIGGVLVGALLVLLLSLSTRAPWLSSLARAVNRHLPVARRQRAKTFYDAVTANFRRLSSEPAIGAKAAAWAAAQWLLDCASLWLFLAAFGAVMAPDTLFIAFCVTNLLAFLPITPGGLGVFEAALTSSLVSLGQPKATIVVAVLAYRLVEFWLPIPVGAVGFLSFTLDRKRPGGRAGEEGTTAGSQRDQ